MNYQFNVENRNLTLEESEVINNFLFKLLQNPVTFLIYRGESIENLKTKLNIRDNDNIVEKLNFFIFNIGEKGRIYQLKYFEKLKEKSIFSIDDTSDKAFKYIFNKIKHVLSTSKNPEIEKFKLNNDAFNLYFLNKDNLDKFVSNAIRLNQKEKLKIRDYYLRFLHRVGFLGFYLNSFMLSTTVSKQIAKEFSSEDDIIFVSWNRTKIIRVAGNTINSNFPKYKIGIYSYQKEITLKGGFFPQEILGFIYRPTSTFHLNPNIFHYPDLIDYMVKNGIPIDQSEFPKILSLTNHSGSFHSDGSTLTDNL